MSPELETLDQLSGGDMPLPLVRQLYPDSARFVRGLSALLQSGDVRLVEEGGADQWRWQEMLADPNTWNSLQVSLTTVGARRMG